MANHYGLFMWMKMVAASWKKIRAESILIKRAMILCLMVQYFMVAIICILAESGIVCNTHKENPIIYYEHQKCLDMAQDKLDAIVQNYRREEIPMIRAELYCVKGPHTI